MLAELFIKKLTYTITYLANEKDYEEICQKGEIHLKQFIMDLDALRGDNPVQTL